MISLNFGSNKSYSEHAQTNKKYLHEIKIFKVKFSICNFFWNISIGLNIKISILFALTLAFERAVLYENVASLFVVHWIIKHCSSFLRKVLVFQKIYFKIRVLKTFKISNDYHIKTCRSLKQRAIFKIPSTVFRGT